MRCIILKRQWIPHHTNQKPKCTCRAAAKYCINYFNRKKIQNSREEKNTVDCFREKLRNLNECTFFFSLKCLYTFWHMQITLKADLHIDFKCVWLCVCATFFLFLFFYIALQRVTKSVLEGHECSRSLRYTQNGHVCWGCTNTQTSALFGAFKNMHLWAAAPARPERNWDNNDYNPAFYFSRVYSESFETNNSVRKAWPAKEPQCPVFLIDA